MRFFTTPALVGLLALAQLVSGCHVDLAKVSAVHYDLVGAANVQARDQRNAHPASKPKHRIALDNVRVFDGEHVRAPGTVVIDGDVIGTDATGAQHVDGEGGILLPGLIDSHCHPANATELHELTRYGVTTGFAMACFTPAFCQSLQNHAGLVDIKTSTMPASAPGSVHGNLTVAATNSTALLLSNPNQVPAWIANQASWDPDYVKLIAESPGLDQPILTALAEAARQHDKLSVCHAAAYEAYSQAITARVNHVHHAPLDKAVDQCLLDRMREQHQISTPTLTIMQAIAKKSKLASFAIANASVQAIHAAHIPILAGTDSNQSPGVIATVPFGSSLHLELELLVAAGLHPTEALRAATVLPARHFGFHDRGSIAPGKRADLLLIQGDPTKNISATRNIKGVWVAGVKYDGSLGG